ncbi:hypothetical protein C1J03_20170 [Sulfitobacter sp. SK012]|uniref:hypothetical protein n=1 Tax=Sulfitobacter sp. SK012 TaxID=1389005 RepID=UPI000E0AE7E7|nr:hypothetical protein [Sulfitobacter sp. SK012]AXI48111.1 hypothetical protein C1J03_20170 [Sulfitobacter sp. SK012]
MSSILLGGLTVQQAPAPQTPQSATPKGEAQGVQAVAPAQSGNASTNNGTPTSHSGLGGGYGTGSGSAPPIAPFRRFSAGPIQTTDATRSSVVNAQVQNAQTPQPDTNSRRRLVESGLDAARRSAQTESTGDDAGEPVPFGSNLPKVDPPDPLPTSPMLKRLSGRDD